jgi:hypothetical protein
MEVVASEILSLGLLYLIVHRCETAVTTPADLLPVRTMRHDTQAANNLLEAIR